MVTELDVLKAARGQIARGYTNCGYVTQKVEEEGSSYIDDFEGDAKALASAEKQGAHIYTCAIGGVEHAIFKLTKKLVNDDQREKYAYPDREAPKPRGQYLALYASVMDRLNKSAKRAGFEHIEEPNTEMPEETSKPIVLRIYDNTIRQVEREQKRQLVNA